MHKSDSAAVQSLLRYRVDSPEVKVSKEQVKMIEKAVKRFVKRNLNLKTPQQIKDLLTILETKDSRSSCITMPLSLLETPDAALVYLQIWRWPNLQDIKQLFGEPFCRHKLTHVSPTADQNTEVCINPYHYRLTGSDYRTMSVSAPIGNRRRDGNSGSAMSITPNDRSANCDTGGLSLSGAFNTSNSNESKAYATFNSAPINVELKSATIGDPYYTSAANGAVGANSNGFAVPAYSGVQTAYASRSESVSSTVRMDEDVMMIKNDPSALSPAYGYNNSQPIGMLGSPSAYLSGNPGIGAGALFIGDNSSLASGSMLSQQQNVSNSAQVVDNDEILYGDVLYMEPTCWCSVQYYEKQHLGEVFHCTSPTLVIDGFCDPSSPRRFCLGRISNPNREPEAEHVRRQIQHGVELYYVAGEVYLENRSENFVFVQSSNMNVRNGWPPYAVCKVGAGDTAQLFANHDFAALLSRSVNEGYESVRRLLDMCSIRMSFVKGWGTQYRSQSLNSVPCWVEICLNGPLQWLDRVLRQMQPDVGKATSIS